MAEFATSVPVSYALWPATTKYLGYEIPWEATPGNSLQELTIRLKQPSLELAAALNENVLRAVASNRALPVNEFLRKEGFSIQLADAGSANMLYCAAVMKLLGKYLFPGRGGYYLPQIQKKAFRLGKEAGVKHYTFSQRAGTLHVVEVPTRSGFSLLVAEPTGHQGWDMLLDWAKIIYGMKQSSGNGVILPRAKIDEAKVDVKALVGMSGGDWVIQEALMAAKFALTAEEVKFEAAFAYSAKRGGPSIIEIPERDDYLADHYLYFALMQPDHLLPLAVGLVPQDELADTGDVS